MKNRKFVIYHTVVMAFAVQLEKISPIVSDELIFVFSLIEIGHIFDINFFLYFNVLDTKKRKYTAHGRSTGDMMPLADVKLMKSVVNAARSHFSGLINQESEENTVSPADRPDFMHNLLFRLVKNIEQICLTFFQLFFLFRFRYVLRLT